MCHFPLETIKRLCCYTGDFLEMGAGACSILLEPREEAERAVQVGPSQRLEDTGRWWQSLWSHIARAVGWCTSRGVGGGVAAAPRCASGDRLVWGGQLCRGRGRGSSGRKGNYGRHWWYNWRHGNCSTSGHLQRFSMHCNAVHHAMWGYPLCKREDPVVHCQ